MSDVRFLASATIDLGTNLPQVIGMGAYLRYFVTGVALVDQSGAGSAIITVRGPDGTVLLQPQGQVGNAMGYSPAKPAVSPIFSGDATVVHGGPLLPGETVTVQLYGTDV